MKPVKFTLLLLIFTLVSCNPNKEFIEKISSRLSDDALGVDLHYKSLEFEFIDTLYIGELQTEAQDDLSAIKHDLGSVPTLSEVSLTLDLLKKLRNQELELRGNNSYYDFLFSDDCYSDWCETLRNQINQTDKLIEEFPTMTDELPYWNNIVWYHIRREQFYGNSDKVEFWNSVQDAIDEATLLQTKVDSLAAFPENTVVNYTAHNRYEIVNPLLNNVKQTLDEYFIFSKDMELVGRFDELD